MTPEPSGGPTPFDHHYHGASLDPNNSLNLPSGNDPRYRPEKIVLQQNWLEEPLLPRTPRTPTQRSSSRKSTGYAGGHLSRSNSVQDCSLSIPGRHEFEFGRNTGTRKHRRRRIHPAYFFENNFSGGRGDWQSIGVRSPIPTKRRDDLNLPAIPTTASSQGGSPHRAPSIELYPSPQASG